MLSPSGGLRHAEKTVDSSTFSPLWPPQLSPSGNPVYFCDDDLPIKTHIGVAITARIGIIRNAASFRLAARDGR